MPEHDNHVVQLLKMENGNSLAANGGADVKMERTPSNHGDFAHHSRSSSVAIRETKSANSAGASPHENASPDNKSSRKAIQKSATRPPTLFDHLPDATEEASRGFALLSDCVYASKALGNSGQESLDCDCDEVWRNGMNHACNEDSDCINRWTKIECVTGNCGDDCQNKRFQRKQYARVSVFKTEKKGFGLRADADLEQNDFVFEYIGEVIGEELFRSRLMKYDKERLEHFYFMSLNRAEYVDATKKGNLGRFCNHSCRPNCFVDKWVVGEKLRMGIFASRRIKAGEELCFNYNVDRYGANPQKCFCGESNCTGILGGKTQTERATKLPLAMVEALGLEDGEYWDSGAAAKKAKKKKTDMDEEYVKSIEPRKLEDNEVGVVMSTLRSCKEKWIAAKLLHRIHSVEEEKVLHRIIKFHGYEYLKTTLNAFRDDDEIVLQVLDILWKFPRMTRNKIDDSNIEPLITEYSTSAREDVAKAATRLLDVWKTLQVGYRIPRAKVDRSARDNSSSVFDDRRQHAREAAAAPPKAPSPVRNAPTGPRNSMPQRNPHYMPPRRRPPPPPRDNTPLPNGWRSAIDQATGRQYYWETANPETKSWVRPTVEAAKASAALQAQKIQDIINQCAQPTPKPTSATQTPKGVGTPVSEPKREKWRSWPAEKQRKLYENTIFPHVKHVADKYYKRLPKEDLKKFVKEINKNLAASDYKHGRVDDPSRISEKQQSKIRKYTRDFLDKAVRKHEQREAERVSRKDNDQSATAGPEAVRSQRSREASPMNVDPMEQDGASDDGRHAGNSPGSPSDLKRKRGGDDGGHEADERAGSDLSPGHSPSAKRLKELSEGGDGAAEAPSPPTPPPLDQLDHDAAEAAVKKAEERQLQEHEDALVRENEEAQRMQKEDAAEQQRLREHEEAMQRESHDTLLALRTERDARKTQDNEDEPMANGLNGTALETVMV